ncbi:MAG: IS1595 family transposase [Candidatus Absconditabacterales bacterium]|jgi:transposase
MYIKNSNLSPFKIRQLITEWVYNTPARACATKIRLHRNTVTWWYNRIREQIALLPDPEPFEGEVEIDESYFGQKRPWIQGTGTIDRVPIFGIKDRKTGKAWATVVEGTNHTYLIPIILKMVKPGSKIYSDGFGAYYHLKNLGYQHYVVIHEYTYVSIFNIHTNGIESFWAYTKNLFHSRKGLPRNRYQLHLKEAIFRFNNRDPLVLRSMVRKLLTKR